MPFFRFTATISLVFDGLLLQSFFDMFIFIFLHKKLISQWNTINKIIKYGFSNCWFIIIVFKSSSAQVARHNISGDGPPLFSDNCHYTERHFLLSLFKSLVTLVTVKAASLVYKTIYTCSEPQINPQQYWFLGSVLHHLVLKTKPFLANPTKQVPSNLFTWEKKTDPISKTLCCVQNTM